MSTHTFLKRGRFWAVHDPSGALVCVVVYKRGARELLRRLDACTTEPLVLHDAAPVAQKPLETLGPSPEATLENLTIRMDQARQQQQT